MKRLVVFFVLIALLVSATAATGYTPFRKYIATGISGDSVAVGDTLWSNVISISGYDKIALYSAYTASAGSDSLVATIYFGNVSSWTTTLQWSPFDANADGVPDDVTIGVPSAGNTATDAILSGSYVGKYSTYSGYQAFGNYVRIRVINNGLVNTVQGLTVKLIAWDHPATKNR